MAKKVNGFLKPVDKIIQAKCKGLAKEKNENKFRINWSYSYEKKIEKSRSKYPQTWGGVYGQWSTMEAKWNKKGGSYLVPARESFVKGWTWRKKWNSKSASTPLFSRWDWYPYSGKPKLKRISMGVYGHNDAGSGPCTVLPYYEFAQPKAPTINAISYNNDNGNVSTKISFKRDLCVKQDTFDMRYRRVVKTYNIVYDSKKKKYISKTEATDWTTNSSGEAPVSYAPGWAKSLSSNQYAVVEWQAYTRGIAGNSCDKFDAKKKAWSFNAYTSRKYVYAWPAKPTVSSKSISYDSKNKMLKVPIKTNHDPDRNPVDKVTLQYNNSTTITKVAELGEVSWTNADNMEDNANCVGFVVPTQDIAPGVGNRLWIRVKAEHGSYTRYSDPVRVDDLYVAEATAADDTCEILATSSPNADGKGVTLNIGYNTSDGNTGTEVSWSTYSGAWQSNEEPSTFNATYGSTENKDASTKSKWPRMHVVNLRGLEENQTYYVRARRYREGENKTTYSPYSKRTFTPSSQPAAVWLTLPESIPYGSDLPVSWGYDSDAEQKAYSVYDPARSSVLWASGNDANGYTVIPWEYVKSKSSYPEEETLQDGYGSAILDENSASVLTEQMSAQGVAVNLCVKMNTGGLSAVSDSATTQITAPPKAAVEIPLDGSFFKRLGSGEIGMVSQGGTVKVNSTAKKASVVLTVLSESIVRAYPDGARSVHSDGDVLWAMEYLDGDLVDVSQNDEGGLSVISCTLPSDLDFVDGCGYTLIATVTDLDTGLVSRQATTRFVVEWAHKPVAAIATVETSSENMTATIGIWKPEGAFDTDVVDVYRVTPDGYYLIAAGVAWGSFVLDRYAPYANDWGETLYYRLSTRTADGAEVWTDDAEYSLYGYSLRFDWEDGDALELPYNLSIADTWSKGFEARKHMDGSYGGYFDGSVMRTASLSTDMIKVSSDGDKRLVRELAGYSGPVFVRTPIGSAYTANVVPNNMTYEFNNPVVAVSFDVTEFKLADQFKVLPDDITASGYSTYEEYLSSL